MKKITALIFGLLVLAVLLVCFFSSGLFKVQAVNVYYPENNGKFDYNDIKNVSSECIGTHILRVSENKLSAKIESEVPYCKVVDIEKKFPSEIVVKTKLREPVVLVQISNRTDVFALIDSQLKILEIISYPVSNPALSDLLDDDYTVLGGLPYVPSVNVYSLPGTFINYEQEGYEYFGTLKDVLECVSELTNGSLTGKAFCDFFDFIDFTKAKSENRIYFSGQFDPFYITIGTKNEMMISLQKILIYIDKQ